MRSLKQIFMVRTYRLPGDLALLLLRVVAGLAFMQHGWPKMQNPFAWMGPDAGFPGFLQALAAFSEFGGGLAWVLGLLTPLASLGVTSTMMVAFVTHAILRGDPFVAGGGGGPSYELASLYLCIALILLSLSPGRYAIDAKVFGSR